MDANLNKLSLYYLAIVVVLFSAMGAGCPRNRQIMNDNAPIVLAPEASLEDVIRVVNSNSSRIQKIQSSGATLTVPGVPPVDANYAFERPRRFRLRAQTLLRGPELDLGSNEETYWMWVRHGDQAVYWGRHDQFYQSAARSVVPVPPDWMIEALGVVEMDPTDEHEGPDRSRPGFLQVRTLRRTPGGDITKLTVLDAERGWVMEQHLFDASNQPIASAVAAGFQYDPVNSVSLPRQVEVHLPTSQLRFTLRTERHLVNQIVADNQELWTMPEISGYPYIDLAYPDALQPTHQPPSSQQFNQQPPLSYRDHTIYRSAQRKRDAAIRRLPPFDRLR